MPSSSNRRRSSSTRVAATLAPSEYPRIPFKVSQVYEQRRYTYVNLWVCVDDLEEPLQRRLDTLSLAEPIRLEEPSHRVFGAEAIWKVSQFLAQLIQRLNSIKVDESMMGWRAEEVIKAWWWSHLVAAVDPFELVRACPGDFVDEQRQLTVELLYIR